MTTPTMQTLTWIPTVTTADLCSAILARLSADGRPGHVSHPNLRSIVTAMHDAGRDELVHYAGACYRDDIAWHLCLTWLADHAATESELKSRAMRAAGWGDVTAEQIRAANPGMR